MNGVHMLKSQKALYPYFSSKKINRVISRVKTRVERRHVISALSRNENVDPIFTLSALANEIRFGIFDIDIRI